MNTINACGMPVGLNVGMALIDRAIAAGYDRRLLRWRVSAAQGFGMFAMNIAVCASGSSVIASMETGMSFEAGIFCGIPYAVDRTMPDDCAWLESLTPKQIGQIDALTIPIGYGK